MCKTVALHRDRIYDSDRRCAMQSVGQQGRVVGPGDCNGETCRTRIVFPI